MFLVSACSCPHTIYWRQVFSREWRCRWSSADKRCSNYIWVINDFIAYSSAPYIRDLMVIQLQIYFSLTLFVMKKKTQNFSHSMTGKIVLYLHEIWVLCKKIIEMVLPWNIRWCQISSYFLWRRAGIPFMCTHWSLINILKNFSTSHLVKCGVMNSILGHN